MESPDRLAATVPGFRAFMEQALYGPGALAQVPPVTLQAHPSVATSEIKIPAGSREIPTIQPAPAARETPIHLTSRPAAVPGMTLILYMMAAVFSAGMILALFFGPAIMDSTFGKTLAFDCKPSGCDELRFDHSARVNGMRVGWAATVDGTLSVYDVSSGGRSLLAMGKGASGTMVIKMSSDCACLVTFTPAVKGITSGTVRIAPVVL